MKRGGGRPGPRDRREGGFTLIEVLAALAVAGLAFTVLLQTDGVNHGRTLRSQLLLGAVHLAGAMMEDVFASGVPALSEEKGEDGVYQWTRTVGDTQFPGVREVAVTLSWPEGEGRRSYRVAAYLPQ